MTRTFFTLDETNALNPVPVLHVNGFSVALSEREFLNLLNDAHWIAGHLDAARGAYFSKLADKYKETQQCAV